jgi:adenine-specific DNA-methyltransferase
MPRKPKIDPAAPNAGDAIASIKYPAKRKNIPPAGLEAQGTLQEAPRIRYEYNPHLPPVLRSAPEAAKADQLPELLAIARQRPLTEAEARTLAEALRRHEPWLEWSGKREKPWFEVEPVALHMHERVSTQAILRVLAREDVERDLFADPQHDYAQAVQFYQHDVDWANRMILGDSLQVMASLARREDLAGKVQMIYIDPPYGIKFASNFQPQLGQRDVKDREQDLTREPEMVKAYRDTWTLGIHSYLAYLRDRLAMAKELLADTGSIFVQISDENLHRVRCVMDEVFGPGNFMCGIQYVKTAGLAEKGLATVADTLLWYARDKAKVKFRSVFLEKEAGDSGAGVYSWLEFRDGTRRRMSQAERDDPTVMPHDATVFRLDNLTSQDWSENASKDIDVFGKTFTCGSNRHWTAPPDGMKRLLSVERAVPSASPSPMFVI